MSSGKPETRKAILDAARALLDKTRGQGVDMEDIAKASGVSRQALYLHFGSRAGLLTAVVDYIEASADLPGRLERIAESRSTPELVDRFAENFATFTPQVHGILTAIDVTRGVDPAAQKAWNELQDERLEQCRKVAERLQRDNLLASPWTVDTAADMLFALTAPRVWEHLSYDRGWKADQQQKHVAELIKRTLLRPE